VKHAHLKVWAVVINTPGGEMMYKVFTNRVEAANYLKTCQRATTPEHFRLVELNLPRFFREDDRMIAR
jgi:hypothetical protein